MKIYAMIMLIFANSCSRLFANGDSSKGSDVEYNAKIIRNILVEGIDSKEDEQKITEVYRKLMEIGTEEAVLAIVKSSRAAIEIRDGEKALDLFGWVLKDISSVERSELYNEVMKTYVEEGRFLYSALYILRKIDKPRVFNYLIKELYNELYNKDHKSPFDPFKSKYRSTLSILWELAELRDKRIVESLQDYEPKGIREKLAIAEAYCLVNHEYEKNLNFILNSFERSIVDDFLSHIEEIGNP